MIMTSMTPRDANLTVLEVLMDGRVLEEQAPLLMSVPPHAETDSWSA